MHRLQPAAHHRVWIDRVVDVVEGRAKKRRLLIIAPPGSAKSTWLSLIFPPWYLGNHPDHSILFFTSSDPMAMQFHRNVKATLEDNPRHLATFPNATCRPDEARGWSSEGLVLSGIPDNVKDPSYRAIGFGASAIGARAHGIILDDPLTQEQAQSETSQAAAKQYYDLTVDSRLHPDGWMIAIMTAWHEADLRAHLASKDDWDVLVMPAIGYWGDGKALWPERFPIDFLRAKQNTLGAAMFSCVWLADPTALGGNVFKAANWFRPAPADFKPIGRVQFWDLAFSSRDTADYTVAVTLDVDRIGNLRVASVWRERVEESSLAQDMANHIALTKPHVVGVEEAAFKQRATADLVARLTLIHRVAARVVPVPVTTDKVFRAQLPAARAQAGMLYVDADAPWRADFIQECMSFPKGANDDQVDALSGATVLALDLAGMAAEDASTPRSYALGSLAKPEKRHWSETSGHQILANGVRR